MKRRAVHFSFHFFVMLLVLIVSPFQFVDAQVSDEEQTCKLNRADSDCIEQPQTSTQDVVTDGLVHKLVELTDDNFEELTWTHTPSTWLVMFKTDSCGICKKALPEFEKLSIDPLLAEHNEKELISMREFKYVKNEVVEEDKFKAMEDVNNVYDKKQIDIQVPAGPVYIATIDAIWSGRDTTKRFGIDATPTIIVVRNEGYDDNMDDTRTYTTYRGQRAQYPLRNFVLGGFSYRSTSVIPPLLSPADAKPNSLVGRAFEVCKPYLTWVGKVLAGWFIFIGLLGLFMRVHNYAWNDKEEDYIEKAKREEEEVEREWAEGKKAYKINQSKEAEERQKKMIQRKLENRKKFAANKEAREKKKKVTPNDNEVDSDDDFDAVGVSIKKSDITEMKKVDAAKSKKSS
jgi:thiol-disulfide isomerase/thioredoxin